MAQDRQLGHRALPAFAGPAVRCRRVLPGGSRRAALASSRCADGELDSSGGHFKRERRAGDGSPPGPCDARLRPLLLAIAGVATASYFYGPPWGARPLGGPIDYHETVHFTALQALRLGGLPYIGAASDQYGPGSQLFIYGWMKLIGGFDLSGFREAYAAQHWLAVALVCVLVLLVLPRRAALLSLALAILVFPTFQLFGFDSAGTSGSSAGATWDATPGSSSRLGATPLATRRPSQPAPCSGRSGSHGGSLSGRAGKLSGRLARHWRGDHGSSTQWVCAAPRSPQPATGRSARAGQRRIAAAADVPRSRRPWSIVRNYFLYPLAVANGFSNTPGGKAGRGTRLPRTPGVHLLCGLIAVGHLRPLGSPPWTRARNLFGCFTAAAVAQAGAFLRADTTHLFNVMLVTPILVGTTAALAGQLLGTTEPWEPLAGRRAGVVAAGLALLPWSTSLPLAQSRLTDPLSARAAHSTKRVTRTALQA